MEKITTFFNSKSRNVRHSYIFIISLIIVGLVFGSIFIFFLDKSDKILLTNYLTDFFNNISNNQLNFKASFLNCLFTNFLIIVSVWLLGLSIIGIPIIIFLLFFKGFITGFSISAIIYQYKLKGILGSLLYIFPHHIINLLAIMLCAFCALKIGLILFRGIIKKQNINFKTIMDQYFIIIVLLLIVTLVSALIETFISPYIIKLFMFLYK